MVVYSTSNEPAVILNQLKIQIHDETVPKLNRGYLFIKSYQPTGKDR